KWDEKQWRVSPGNLAKAIILTPFLCIGARIPLYSIHENFQSVDMSLLFEDKVEAEWLTRDALACLLDRFYEAGCEHIFTQIALKVYDVFNIPFQTVFHGDTTTFVLYGKYKNADPDVDDVAAPARGFSKAGKRNLKQVLLGMITDNFGIPLSISVRSGNQNDSKWNRAIIDTLGDLVKTATTTVTYIADSKLTTAPNLKKLIKNGFQFVSLCPANFEQKLSARVVKSAYTTNDWTYIGTYRKSKMGKLVEYEAQEFIESVCGTLCRLLVLRSSEKKKEAVTVLEKEKDEIKKLINASMEKEFFCEADAKKEVVSLLKSLKNRVWTVQCKLVTKDVEPKKRPVGRPRKNTPILPKSLMWKIEVGDLIVRQEKYNLMLWRNESFDLYTTVIRL
ncbi:MAG: IS1634 family transposase, partial [Methanoregula sp.]|nr:IS1634 family transposase [Methanoregula sp.]